MRDRRWRRAAWVVFGLVAAVGCSDANTFEGRYTENFLIEAAQGGEDLEFTIALDLFQFGDDVGGIVRYYSVQDLAPGASPAEAFAGEERLCFWTSQFSVGSGDQFSLAYSDEYGVVNTLSLTGLNEGGRLIGTLVPDSRAVYPDSAHPSRALGQSIQLDRVSEGAASGNVCARAPKQFNLTINAERPLVFSAEGETRASGRCSTCSEEGTFCDPRTGRCLAAPECADVECPIGEVCNPVSGLGECVDSSPQGRFEVGIAWKGNFGNEIMDWSYRAASLPRDGDTNVHALNITLDLSPGRWRDRLPLSNIGAGVGVAVGVVLVYRNDDVPLGPEVRGETEPGWDTLSEPIVGTSFRTDVCGGFGSTADVGRVLLYIEGDLSNLPEDSDFFQLFPEGSLGPKEGYGVYDVCFRGSSIFRLSRAAVGDTIIELTARPSSAFMQESDPARSLPRLPPL